MEPGRGITGARLAGVPGGVYADVAGPRASQGAVGRRVLHALPVERRELERAPPCARDRRRPASAKLLLGNSPRDGTLWSLECHPASDPDCRLCGHVRRAVRDRRTNRESGVGFLCDVPPARVPVFLVFDGGARVCQPTRIRLGGLSVLDACGRGTAADADATAAGPRALWRGRVALLRAGGASAAGGGRERQD